MTFWWVTPFYFKFASAFIFPIISKSVLWVFQASNLWAFALKSSRLSPLILRMYLEFGFSIMAAGKKMDKRQARMGQNPRQVSKYSTCWLLWFFFPFFWIFHSDLTHSQRSTVTGEFLLGRAEKLKILTLKWESPFSHSNATQWCWNTAGN